MLQETRWPVKGITDRNKDIMLYTNKRTIFIQDGLSSDLMINFEAVNEKISRIRSKGIFLKISLVNAHVQTEDKEEFEKENIHTILERTVNIKKQYSASHDFHAKVGREQIYPNTR